MTFCTGDDGVVSFEPSSPCRAGVQPSNPTMRARCWQGARRCRGGPSQRQMQWHDGPPTGLADGPRRVAPGHIRRPRRGCKAGATVVFLPSCSAITHLASSPDASAPGKGVRSFRRALTSRPRTSLHASALGLSCRSVGIFCESMRGAK